MPDVTPAALLPLDLYQNLITLLTAVIAYSPTAPTLPLGVYGEEPEVCVESVITVGDILENV